MKKLVLLFTLVAFGFAFVSCGETTTEEVTTATTAEQTTAGPEMAQGVTETTIKVGNTAAVSGFLAFVGIPFNAAIEAVFKQVNDAGGIDGRTIEFVSYDDTFDAALGVTYTETLVEDDEVFALVGHFGTPTVGATIDYIQEKGVPMVYAATGINALYFEESLGNPVMAVQPIYMTDGRIMTSRAIMEKVYGAGEDEALAADGTIGVLYTNDDVGNSIKAGVEAEMAALGIAANRVYYIAVTDLTVDTAILLLKGYGVSSVICAMNQGPFAYTLTSMYNQTLEVPVFSSYVNADVSAVDHTQFSAARPVYTNAWVDIFSEKGQLDVDDYVACIAQADLTDEEKAAYYTNSYATAGYIAAMVFVAGLERVAANGEDLTWDNYIAAMEESPIDIPMGGTVDFSGGKRWGISAMSLLKYDFVLGDDPTTTDVVETDFVIESFGKVREIETLLEIEAKS
ncbi:ABC transporter substrate-binding protein [Mycoplasmatota bacterium WC30]